MQDKSALSRPPSVSPRNWIGYIVAMAGVALTTGIIQAVPSADEIPSISLLYLLVVIATAYLYGRVAAVVAAFLAVISYNWFFVEPRYTFTINNPAEWLALTIFLATAIVISQLTQNLRLRAEEAARRERETAALAQASWAVASQVGHQQTLAEVLRQTISVVPAEAAAIVTQAENGEVEIVATHQAVAGSMSRLEEDIRNATKGHVRLPLMIEGYVIGALCLRRTGAQSLSDEERRVAESLANHAAVALERHRLTQSEGRAQVVIEADKLKTALLSMVSHDFRSPLAAIKASVTSLLQDDAPWEAGTQHELLNGINDETDRLNRMVGDILALSRLEGGAWRPQRELVPVSEVIGAALDSFSDAENERIRVQIEPGIPEVSLDTVQIVQVLHNLIENALKYSPPTSPVELSIEIREQTLSIAVMDRGVGLPEGEEQFLFERFYRATRWRESATPGSGLGLALCRGLVEAHGGHLETAAREGGGAIFRITLPFEVPHPNA